MNIQVFLSFFFIFFFYKGTFSIIELNEWIESEIS